ncbi:MAG: spermidine synthase [Alcaligenaceae bacterium]|nr:spermidine synthase [Alcaligenaceae bacterium]
MHKAAPGPRDEPTLSESDGIRYLHFDSVWVQGAMRVKKPDELVLAYTQQMMAWLLFLEPSRKDTLGFLGLGAGSLLRFAHKHMQARLCTAEWNPAVTAICRAYFRLPESKRSTIDHQDAALWVRQPDQVGRFRALMVDLYDADALGPVRDSLEFYQDCFHALDDVGVMAVNLFGNHSSFAPNIERLREVFQGRVLELPEIDEGNRIVLGLKGPLLDVSVAQFLDRAHQVEQVYGLPAVQWARSLLSQLTQDARVRV